MNPVKSSSSIVLVAIPFWWILQDMSIVKEELIRTALIGLVLNFQKAQNVLLKLQQMEFKSQSIVMHMLILLMKEL
jgi:hypothetical protein